MNVAIEIPENVSAPLRLRWKDVPRRVLEAVAAEAYRSGALTAHQVGELLGHGSRWETESFLKRVTRWKWTRTTARCPRCAFAFDNNGVYLSINPSGYLISR